MQSVLLAPENFTVKSRTPEGLHVAIIMDGNGRWATRRGLPRVLGYRVGGAAARRVIEHAPYLDIRRLTLYAFSSDNWRRPALEVQRIFWWLRGYLRLERERLRQAIARVEVIGRRDRLPKLLLHDIEEAERVTADGRRIHVCVAVDYYSRDAITRAATNVSFTADNDRPPSANLLARMLAQKLNAGSGDVDLLIRNGGEKRVSDLLLWESAYAELLFTDCLWPDFDASDLDAALQEFRHRERRFSGVAAAPRECPAQSVGGAR